MTPDLQPQWIDLGTSVLRFVHHETGSGLPILLLHELGGSIETWDRTFAILARHHQVIAADLRGFGHSSAVEGTITLDDHVADLVGLLNARGLTGPVVVAGCAIGSAVAAALAARHPDRIAAVVMLSPALEIPPERHATVLGRIADFEANGMRAFYTPTLDGGYPDRFRDADPERTATFMARWLANSPSGFAANFRMLVNMNINPVLAGIACPVLVVAGEYDAVRPPGYVRTVHDRLPRSDFMTVAGGHHMPHQIPEIVADVITGFHGRFA